MRILFITQWFQPESFLKGLPFAKELIKRGHSVEVLTGFPNYPGGKLYPGYKIKFLQREEMDGVSVIRIPLYPSHDNSSIRRLMNYSSFALSAATMGPFLVKKADVAYVYNPPSTVCFSAGMVKLLRGIPLVYDIQDLWPESLADSEMFKNKVGMWLVDRFCRLYYRVANKIVVLSPGYKDELIKRGVREDKIEVIYNWCDDTQIHPVPRSPELAAELGMAGKFNIMFAGNMGKAQSLGAVLDAAKIVEPKCPNVQFVFIGGGVDVDSLKQKAASLNLKNTLFLKPRPVSEISEVLSLADVLLVHLKEYPLFKITIPSKIQAYLCAGKPILAGVKGNAAELALKSGAGIKCEPENLQSIAEAVVKFQSLSSIELDAMGARGRKFYQDELSLSIGTTKFEQIFKSVVRM